jgi:hypothetical protein
MTQPNQPPFQPDPNMFGNPKASRAAAKAYAKAQRPFYKKKRVLIPAAVVALGVFAAAGSGGGGDKEPVEVQTVAAEDAAAEAAVPKKEEPAAKPVEPALVVSSAEMIELLEGNALKAKNTYEGKQVQVSGFVGSIDASGDYFSLDPEPDAIVFTGVQVQTGSKFADQLANFEKGQTVTVIGQDHQRWRGHGLHAQG